MSSQIIFPVWRPNNRLLVSSMKGRENFVFFCPYSVFKLLTYYFYGSNLFFFASRYVHILLFLFLVVSYCGLYQSSHFLLRDI